MPDNPHEQEDRRLKQELLRLETILLRLKQKQEHHRRNWIWALAFGVWGLGAYILQVLWDVLWDVHIVDNYTPSFFLRVVLVIAGIIWSYALVFLPDLIERWFFPPPEE